MLPKVSPVDISRVVYIASLGGDLKNLVIGNTPTNLVAILAASSSSVTPTPEASAGTETKEPARMK